MTLIHAFRLCHFPASFCPFGVASFKSHVLVAIAGAIWGDVVQYVHPPSPSQANHCPIGRVPRLN